MAQIFLPQLTSNHDFASGDLGFIIARHASLTLLLSPALSGWPGAQLLKLIGFDTVSPSVDRHVQTKWLIRDWSTRQPANQNWSQLSTPVQHMPNNSYGRYRKHGMYVRVYINPHFAVWYRLTNKRKPTQPTVIKNDASDSGTQIYLRPWYFDLLTPKRYCDIWTRAAYPDLSRSAS